MSAQPEINSPPTMGDKLDRMHDIKDELRTLDDIMAQMFEIRDEKRELDQRKKELEGEWRALEGELLAALHAQGADKVSTSLGSASRSEEEVPHVVDWDEFHQYILDTGRFELLQRRAASGAWRELRKLEGDVPGVNLAHKVSINLRKK